MKKVKFLPPATRTYLFDIVVNHLNAPSEAFNQNPGGVAGVTKKYAWQQGWGLSQGKERLLRHIDQQQRRTWWVATHLGDDKSYKFEQIEFPTCPGCAGTANPLCGNCHGAGQVNGSTEPRVTLLMLCPTCNGSRSVKCPLCCANGANPDVIDGVSINKNAAGWS